MGGKSTAPTWKGDLNFSKRGPKGDWIMSEKGTKRGPYLLILFLSPAFGRGPSETFGLLHPSSWQTASIPCTEKVFPIISLGRHDFKRTEDVEIGS